MSKIALWINVYADNWTAERAIITSNGAPFKLALPISGSEIAGLDEFSNS